MAEDWAPGVALEAEEAASTEQRLSTMRVPRLGMRWHWQHTLMPVPGCTRPREQTPRSQACFPRKAEFPDLTLVHMSPPTARSHTEWMEWLRRSCSCNSTPQ